MRAHRWSGNWDLHTIVNKGGVGVWDFKGEGGVSHRDGKTNVCHARERQWDTERTGLCAPSTPQNTGLRLFADIFRTSIAFFLDQALLLKSFRQQKGDKKFSLSLLFLKNNQPKIILTSKRCIRGWQNRAPLPFRMLMSSSFPLLIYEMAQLIDHLPRNTLHLPSRHHIAWLFLSPTGYPFSVPLASPSSTSQLREIEGSQDLFLGFFSPISPLIPTKLMVLYVISLLESPHVYRQLRTLP